MESVPLVPVPFVIIGRGERIRTSDHLNPIQVRYLAALRPGFVTSLLGWPDRPVVSNRPPGTAPFSYIPLE